MPRFQVPTEFGKTLRAEGHALIAASPTKRFADRSQWLRALLAVVALGAAYALLLSIPTGYWSLALAGLSGILAYTVVATLCHDASHGSLSPVRFVNRAILFLGFALVGVSGSLWGRRHVRTHHMFPNVSNTDIDADSTILVRLTPHRPWHLWHVLQIIYAPLLYMLVLAHLAFFEDFKYLRQAVQEAPEEFNNPAVKLEFAVSKFTHVVLALVVPWLVLDCSLAALMSGYLIASAAASLMFVMINVGTHICDQAIFVEPNENGSIEHDWATHQTLTAVDWAPESALAVALTGGANAHAAHHLFPEAAHCHNARLSRLVSNCADRFGVRHNVVSFAEMLASHFRHLWALSWPDRRDIQSCPSTTENENG